MLKNEAYSITLFAFLHFVPFVNIKERYLLQQFLRFCNCNLLNGVKLQVFTHHHSKVAFYRWELWQFGKRCFGKLRSFEQPAPVYIGKKHLVLNIELRKHFF